MTTNAMYTNCGYLAARVLHGGRGIYGPCFSERVNAALVQVA